MADSIKRGKVSDLTPDLRNANRGTEYGGVLLEKSMRELGAGRSVLVDRNGNLIAGNKTSEVASAIGLEDTIVVETDGSKLVVVKRMDLDIDSAEGRQLALADNQVGRVNLDFDTDLVRDLADDFSFDLGDWGLDAFNTQTEKKEKEIDQLPTEHKCPSCGHTW